MYLIGLSALVLLLLSFPSFASSNKIVKDSILSQDKKRAFYLFVPDSINASSPAPLLVMLHGSGRNGMSLVEKWKDFATQRGIIVVGPDSLNSAGWFAPADGPDFLYDLIESLKSKYPINPRRVYLFGHSGGASFALYMSLYESQYFAATSVHAGAMQKETYALIDYAKRKIPIFIQVGTRDDFFPLKDVQATRDELKKRGLSVEMLEIANHDHNYYVISEKVNEAAWEFLKKYELAGEPKYERYRFSK